MAYVVNSLVDIDGGTGNDRAVVVGTEANDQVRPVKWCVYCADLYTNLFVPCRCQYVVTDGQIFGGGLVIKFAK